MAVRVTGIAGVAMPEKVAVPVVNMAIVPVPSFRVRLPESVAPPVMVTLDIRTRVLSQALKLALTSAMVAIRGVMVLFVLFTTAFGRGTLLISSNLLYS